MYLVIFTFPNCLISFLTHIFIIWVYICCFRPCREIFTVDGFDGHTVGPTVQNYVSLSPFIFGRNLAVPFPVSGRSRAGSLSLFLSLNGVGRLCKREWGVKFVCVLCYCCRGKEVERTVILKNFYASLIFFFR